MGNCSESKEFDLNTHLPVSTIFVTCSTNCYFLMLSYNIDCYMHDCVCNDRQKHHQASFCVVFFTTVEMPSFLGIHCVLKQEKQKFLMMVGLLSAKYIYMHIYIYIITEVASKVHQFTHEKDRK